MTRWGATTEEWAHFEWTLELGDRLLPVVSNPAAPISPDSRMKGLGKTPSWYNGRREAAGIPKWTERAAPTAQELARWQKETDYGLCIRTGHSGSGAKGSIAQAVEQIIAIDIDIDEAERARSVGRVVAEHLGPLPLRSREGTGKALALFRLAAPPLYKRILRTGDGLVEFLATGQQFVGAGTHVSGARYVWDGGLPTGIPTVTLEAVEAMWQALCDQFAVAPPVDASARRRGETVEADDDRLDWLEENWTAFGYGRDGQLFIECPWKDGHSGDSGETETAYFPAGSGGYAQGHYKCLHASCGGRSDNDFDMATGYAESDLVDLVPTAVEGEAPEAAAPRFVRDGNGKIESLVFNLEQALLAHQWLGRRIAYDAFLDEIMLSTEGGPWLPMMDEHRTELRLWLEKKGFKPIKREDLRDIIRAVAKRNRFDSAQQWLGALVWDGRPRVRRFLATYFAAAPGPYAEAVSLYWWTAHAARVLDPGHQCDMIPILVSEEGRYKSTSLQAMVPTPDQYVEIDLEHRDNDLSRRMRGSLIGELAELRGLQGRSGEANKAWVTRRFEEWVPKYVESAQRVPRRLVCVGTTNETAILNGTTGERRWLPIEVGGADREAIERDREQLWAEAKTLFDKTGEVWWQGAYELGPAARERFQAHDIWEAAVDRWLCDAAVHPSGPPEAFSLEDVFFGALGISATKTSLGDQHRMGKVLRACGFELARKRTEGRRTRVWTAVDRCDPLGSGPAKPAEISQKPASGPLDR